MSHETALENFRFFVLPNNTSGSVSIPLSLTPTTLASLTLRSNCNFDFTALSATVGWQAVNSGTILDRVNVLFKIWRGTPSSGCLIYSASDCAGCGANSLRLTNLAQIDTGLRSFKAPIYVLTAELTDLGSAANVIGPITFTATEFEK